MKSIKWVAFCTAAMLVTGAAVAQTPTEAAKPAATAEAPKPAKKHHTAKPTEAMAAKPKEPKTQTEACEWEAKDKKLAGAAKKSFMKDCTSK